MTPSTGRSAALARVGQGQQWADQNELMNYYGLLLDSLKESEDLTATQQNGYSLKPKALNTLAAFEQEERRHRDNFSISAVSSG